MSCLVPTIQILQPNVSNPILRPRLTRGKTQQSTTSPSQKRRKKSYPTGGTSSLSLPRLFPKMRLTAVRNSTLFSLFGLSSTQSSPSTWAQTQPFNVDVSTESLLSSATQGLTNIVGANTPYATAAATTTTALAPAVSITDAFSTTMPTELSTGSSPGNGSGVVSVTSSRASAESERSVSVGTLSASRSAGANSSTTMMSATIPSEAAAAPTGGGKGRKVMGVAGVLAGAAGVMFV